MKQNEIRKRSLSPLDTGYARLLCVYSLARGALALWALIVLGNFAAGRLKLQNPLGRLSAFPKVYVVLALGAAGFCGLLLAFLGVLVFEKTVAAKHCDVEIVERLQASSGEDKPEADN